MGAKENKEAEDPLMPKWKRTSFRKSCPENYKLKRKSENMLFSSAKHLLSKPQKAGLLSSAIDSI